MITAHEAGASMRRLWQQDFVRFMLLAGLLFAALFTGAVDWLSEQIGEVVDRWVWGDAGTWFSGLATTAVAALAWRTSRAAARTAESAFADQLRAEASRVTWWFEVSELGERVDDPHVMEFPPPLGGLPWEHTPPEPGEARGAAVLRIQNRNDHPVGDVRVLVHGDYHVDEHSLGVQVVGLLRPGVSRFRVHLAYSGATPGSEFMVDRLTYENAFADWLEFTDSKGNRWRRFADGRLEPHQGVTQVPVSAEDDWA